MNPTPLAPQRTAIWLLIAALQPLPALLALLNLPGSGTTARIILMMLPAGLSLVLLILAALSFTRPQFGGGLYRRATPILTRRPMVVGASALLLLGTTFSLSAPGITEVYTQAYAQRFAPLAALLASYSAQILLARHLLLHGWRGLLPKNRFSRLATLLFTGFIGIWGIMFRTRLGLTIEAIGWYELAAPLLETQVLLAGALAAVLLLLRMRLPRPKALDLWLSLAIWLAAFGVWAATPAPPSWFLAVPRPPNFEAYPNSDTLLYDTSGQTALIGYGLTFDGSPLARRPMHAAYIAALNALANLNPQTVALLQCALLSLFPVFIYHAVRPISNRTAAITAALLITLRETNAIAAADLITTSHAKLLMADLPTALGAALFAALGIRLVQRDDPPPLLPLLTGGALGAFVLIRLEIGGLMLPMLLAAAWTWRKTPRRLVQNSALLLVGLTLVLLPWMARNYALTKQIFLDVPASRAQLVAQRYAPPAEAALPQMQAGETQQEFTGRAVEQATEFATNNPQMVTHFIANHALNSAAQSVLLLPAAFRPIEAGIAYTGHKLPEQLWEECCTVRMYIRKLPFWHVWDGSLPPGSAWLIGINLLLLALGMAQADKAGASGWLLLGFWLVHIMVNAVFRNSGGRYILPVDWVSVAYFSIGLTRALAGILGVDSLGETARTRKPPLKSAWAARQPWGAALLGALILLGVGSIPPISEKLVAPRYDAAWVAAARAQVTLPALQGYTVWAGRALYPRFYRAGQGEPGSRKTNFTARAYDRTAFTLIGAVQRQVQLLSTVKPEQFPHGADVLVFGCEQLEGYANAAAVAIFNADGSLQTLLTRPQGFAPCPMEAVVPPVEE